ncbi:FAD/NAD(P)-binding protein [Rhodohalobacter sp. SW132]|nr:FAD/NAD(P)-binding protein [Rhodohalobacter sp. SW132]
MINRDSILDWAIIGGGIHGTYLANTLIRQRVAGRSDLRVIDPHGKPLHQWKKVTASVGMEYLRSPKVHHLDLEPFSLKHYAQCERFEDKMYITPNDRPSLKLFNDHTDSVIETSGLNEIYRKGYALNIEWSCDHAVITTDHEVIRAKKVILAIGQGGSANWPEWAKDAALEGAAICHVLEGAYCREQIPESGEVVVVGGGMSAVQTALSIADENRHVTLLSPHSLRQNNYDSDPGWMGPKYLNRFREISCLRKRRRIINEARNSGSITHDLKWELIKSQNKNECSLIIDTVRSCSVLTNDLLLLNLKSGETLAANHIVLATGYENERPGGRLIDRLISKYDLKCSECGFPITDTSLQWYENLYVSGGLAELEVGPASRNIVGARMAARKILNMTENNF